MTIVFHIFRYVLLILLICELLFSIILGLLSITEIVLINDRFRKRDLMITVIDNVVVAANAILGLLGVYRKHVLLTLLFAIFQTSKFILHGLSLKPFTIWYLIQYVASPVLAYVLAFMIMINNNKQSQRSLTWIVFHLVRFVLLICLTSVLQTSFILGSFSITEIVFDKRNLTLTVIEAVVVAANAILGLLGVSRKHILITLLFAIFQTLIIILHWLSLMPFAISSWIFIPWVGSPVLAYVLAFMIKKDYSQEA